MKICIVVDNLNESAGWGRLARKLEEHLVAKGHTVGFITQGKEESGSTSRLNVPLRNYSLWRPFEFLGALLKIRRYASTFDTVLCFDANPYGVIMAIALIGTPSQFVLYSLGTYSLLTKSVLRNALMRFAFKRADKLLIVGEFVKSQMEQSGLVLPKYSLLPVGVDPNVFYSNDVHSDRVKTPYIIGVGGIKKRKGFHLSIEAFGNIASKFPDLSYAIVGHADADEYTRSLKMRLKELGLEEKIVFLTNVRDEELRALYTHAEFFVLTPITDANALEGFGMVYLEAAMCGTPAVGTLNSGAVEAIVDGETGLLVSPSPQKIAGAFTKMLSNEDFRKQAGIKAKLRAKEFSWDIISQTLIDSLVL